jgi:hypothetical protein
MVQIPAGTRTILSVNLRGFHQSFRASVGMATRLGYDRLLPNPSRIISHHIIHDILVATQI